MKPLRAAERMPFRLSETIRSRLAKLGSVDVVDVVDAAVVEDISGMVG
jgi:hypothetical protein